ncbi:hypothetical protein BZA77DRAFT_169836 [Pyronema omphalodes]|nr:hypothetical protein BZA77DRAFT_169836 [Pyronema omphalodes]
MATSSPAIADPQFHSVPRRQTTLAVREQRPKSTCNDIARRAMVNRLRQAYAKGMITEEAPQPPAVPTPNRSQSRHGDREWVLVRQEELLGLLDLVAKVDAQKRIQKEQEQQPHAVTTDAAVTTTSTAVEKLTSSTDSTCTEDDPHHRCGTPTHRRQPAGDNYRFPTPESRRAALCSPREMARYIEKASTAAREAGMAANEAVAAAARAAANLERVAAAAAADARFSDKCRKRKRTEDGMQPKVVVEKLGESNEKPEAGGPLQLQVPVGMRSVDVIIGGFKVSISLPEPEKPETEKETA